MEWDAWRQLVQSVDWSSPLDYVEVEQGQGNANITTLHVMRICICIVGIWVNPFQDVKRGECGIRFWAKLLQPVVMDVSLAQIYYLRDLFITSLF